MAGLLEQAGYAPANDASEADVVVVNTCSVRERAEEKLYTRLGELRQLAAAQGHDRVVLATGSRSEAYVLATWPDVPAVCVVEVGDFTGIALRRAAAAGMRRAVLVAMAGKITKLAAGVMMTHFHRSKVDNDLMARVAREASAPPPVVAAATATATARHFFEACRAQDFATPLAALCREARASCEALVEGRLAVEVWMVDFDGAEVVARA